MKWIREILPRGKEAAFASGLLLLYAVELFLSPDPEWTMWAAQMAVGVLYVPDAPTLQGSRPAKPCGSCRRPERLESSRRRLFWRWGSRRHASRAPHTGPFRGRRWMERYCERSHGTVSRRKYRGGRWKEKEVSTMEGILFDIEMFASPITVLLGLVLLAIGACGILLGHMADEEASGKEIFWAESPFTDVSVSETPVESVRYRRAA